jgi:Creatinase/Prolidase N-terminal domain
MSFDFEGRWARAATVMRARGIDAMFVMKPTNLTYLPATADRARSDS